MSEPKKVDVTTWYIGGPTFRCELRMEFATEDEAQDLAAQVRRMREGMARGEKPRVLLQLWTEPKP